ncbi:hypothetical protein HPB47_022933 [Ixodes persulcatus]|uniref:Uncharacterized protein n=1 Tax=Ixodes persulcatus TaxID=34615 RepID=A0AC60Q8C2_IXOPE|nr:hypothetical protein HPB47_022933 [Ixodes persulcatus]
MIETFPPRPDPGSGDEDHEARPGSSSDGLRPASSPPTLVPTSPSRRAGAATRRLASAVSTTFRKLGHKLGHHRHHQRAPRRSPPASAESGPRRNLFHFPGRLSVSHPDVSCSDLAALARDSAASCPLPRGQRKDVTAAGGASYSDPTMLRSRRRMRVESTEDETSSMTPPLASSTPPSSRLAGVDSTDLSDVFGLRSRRAAAGAPDSATAGVVLYKLQVHLRCGKNLVAKDACGSCLCTEVHTTLHRESAEPPVVRVRALDLYQLKEEACARCYR